MIGSMSSMSGMMAGMGAMMGNRPSQEEMFAKLDGDGNGGISLEELEGTKLGDRIGEDFASIDTDGNGELSADEMQTHKEAKMAEMQSQGGGMMQSILEALMAIEESEDSTETDSTLTDEIAVVTDTAELEDTLLNTEEEDETV